MRMGNGNGSVFKMKDKRRKPWRVVVTLGIEYDEEKGKAVQKRRVIGNYATQREALDALHEHFKTPYDIDARKVTFAEVYERWSEGHFKTIMPSSARTWKSAYTRFAPIQTMRFADVRPIHIEGCMGQPDVSDIIKGRMKNLSAMMYRFAIKHEIASTNYADLCDSVKTPPPEIVRIPFTEEEERALWENLDFPFADMLLIGMYSGWRPQELTNLRLADVDLENRFFVGGMKTKAGRNRTVPIHSKVYDLVEQRYHKSTQEGGLYLFNNEKGGHMSYHMYWTRFNRIIDKFQMLSHRPHDTRHTFVTKAKNAKMDEYLLKLIVGHEIADVTEKVYTHRSTEELKVEIEKIP